MAVRRNWAHRRTKSGPATAKNTPQGLETNKSLMQIKTEEREYYSLVKEVSSLGFSHSKQLSNYIVRHRLGNKYKNISGILEMEANGVAWDFNGGFPPNIYARLCDALGLDNQNTDAKPGRFRAYKELGEQE